MKQPKRRSKGEYERRKRFSQEEIEIDTELGKGQGRIQRSREEVERKIKNQYILYQPSEGD
jgi:hypothetical protein